jgi:hypothetical protein
LWFIYPFFYNCFILAGLGFLVAQNQLTLPYTESFENGYGNFRQSSADDFDWTRKSRPVGLSQFTGPTSADQGSYYVYPHVHYYFTT